MCANESLYIQLPIFFPKLIYENDFKNYSSRVCWVKSLFPTSEPTQSHCPLDQFPVSPPGELPAVWTEVCVFSLPPLFILGIFFFFFLHFLPTCEACLSFQARGQIRATVASVCHSHSHMGSESCLRPTLRFTAMLSEARDRTRVLMDAGRVR